MLAQRVITAAVGIPIIIGLTLLGGLPYAIVAGAILAIAALEYAAATRPPGVPQPQTPNTSPAALLYQPLTVLLAAASAAALASAAREGFDEMTGVMAIGIALLFVPLVLRGEPDEGLRDFARAVPGIAYIGFLGAHLVLLRELDDDGEWWVFLVLVGTWLTDTSSYFAGKTFGRHHPVPRISPGKTSEGFVAGYAGGFAGIIALDLIFNLAMSTLE